MASIKQVEAFYWSATLGSFVEASKRLNTTQSNISKRIQEMEDILRVTLFDRTRRSVRLTPVGESLMRVSEDLLRARNGINTIAGSPEAAAGPFRFGVTESVGLTWLPHLCLAIKQAYPRLMPVARVDVSSQLNAMLRDKTIDFAIGTTLSVDPHFQVLDIAHLERVWLGSPLLISERGPISPQTLASVPILGHSDIAETEMIVNRYLRKHGLSANIHSSCNNLTALAQMAVAGIGITYLPKGVFDDEIRRGKLHELQTQIDFPPLQYRAVFRDDPISYLTESIANIAKSVCDFSRSDRFLV